MALIRDIMTLIKVVMTPPVVRVVACHFQKEVITITSRWVSHDTN